MSACLLCPRQCGADREGGGSGVCGVSKEILVCRAAPHFGEEPCISGVRGSGAVFFAGCNLHCPYCQNWTISRGAAGTPVTKTGLREIFLRLRDRGVHNINLVTASHYSAQVAAALDGLELGIPVVWNSAAYETVEQLRALEGLVQVYLPDLKYATGAFAVRCGAPADYPQIALAALGEMYRQTGPAQMDGDGLLRRGVLVRHLILPGGVANTRRVLEAVERTVPPEGILFSLMSQYTPMPPVADHPLLGRRIKSREYRRCLSYLDASAIEHGYTQALESASEEPIPAFDGTGVFTQEQ